jgi:hypothetical protein
VGSDHQTNHKAGKHNTTENQSLGKVEHRPVYMPVKGSYSILADTPFRCKVILRPGGLSISAGYGTRQTVSTSLCHSQASPAGWG